MMDDRLSLSLVNVLPSCLNRWAMGPTNSESVFTLRPYNKQNADHYRLPGPRGANSVKTPFWEQLDF